MQKIGTVFFRNTEVELFGFISLQSLCSFGGAKSKVGLIKPGKTRDQPFPCLVMSSKNETCTLYCKKIIFIKYQFHYLLCQVS